MLNVAASNRALSRLRHAFLRPSHGVQAPEAGKSREHCRLGILENRKLGTVFSASTMNTTNLTSAQLNGILSIADDAIICVDGAQTIILFNQGTERIFGWAAQEVRGRDLNLLMPQRYRHEHGKHIENFDKSKQHARQMSERRAIFGMRKDGTEFPAEASSSKLEELEVNGNLVQQ